MVDGERIEGKNLYQKRSLSGGEVGGMGYISHYLGKADGGEIGTWEEKETK